MSSLQCWHSDHFHSSSLAGPNVVKVLLVIAAPFLTRESTKSGCLRAGCFLMDCPTLGHQSQIWVSTSFTLLLRNPNTLGALKWRAECGHQVGCRTLNLRRQSDNGSLELTVWQCEWFTCLLFCMLLFFIAHCCTVLHVDAMSKKGSRVWPLALPVFLGSLLVSSAHARCAPERGVLLCFA